ncbi:MAG: NifU family protein [bacterium]|nr:NifU family protein [bacterium]
MTEKEIKKIRKLVEDFRVVVQSHRGDVEIEEIKGNTIYLKLLGACVNCHLANMSYDIILGGMIREINPKVEIKFNTILKNNKKITPKKDMGGILKKYVKF